MYQDERGQPRVAQTGGPFSMRAKMRIETESHTHPFTGDVYPVPVKVRDCPVCKRQMLPLKMLNSGEAPYMCLTVTRCGLQYYVYESDATPTNEPTAWWP